jgi:hypothetical protein
MTNLVRRSLGDAVGALVEHKAHRPRPALAERVQERDAARADTKPPVVWADDDAHADAVAERGVALVVGTHRLLGRHVDVPPSKVFGDLAPHADDGAPFRGRKRRAVAVERPRGGHDRLITVGVFKAPRRARAQGVTSKVEHDFFRRGRQAVQLECICGKRVGLDWRSKARGVGYGCQGQRVAAAGVVGRCRRHKGCVASIISPTGSSRGGGEARALGLFHALARVQEALGVRHKLELWVAQERALQDGEAACGRGRRGRRLRDGVGDGRVDQADAARGRDCGAGHDRRVGGRGLPEGGGGGLTRQEGWGGGGGGGQSGRGDDCEQQGGSSGGGGDEREAAAAGSGGRGASARHRSAHLTGCLLSRSERRGAVNRGRRGARAVGRWFSRPGMDVGDGWGGGSRMAGGGGGKREEEAGDRQKALKWRASSPVPGSPVRRPAIGREFAALCLGCGPSHDRGVWARGWPGLAKRQPARGKMCGRRGELEKKPGGKGGGKGCRGGACAREERMGLGKRDGLLGKRYVAGCCRRRGGGTEQF